MPQLNFNEQTATAVFGGFQDKKFGNTLLVRPSVNKDSFITLSVKPEISNKVGDATFVFAGATVASPVIDTRSLDSNVLIKSGDTLAIGGLLQDEQTKARNKVPILGDMPILGYLFQEKLNARTKRNLLVFVTPTIIDQRYGTGLEDQVSGLHHSGEENMPIQTAGEITPKARCAWCRPRNVSWPQIIRSPAFRLLLMNQRAKCAS